MGPPAARTAGPGHHAAPDHHAPVPDTTAITARVTARRAGGTDPATIEVTNRESRLYLDAGKDYVVELPSTPLTAPGGLWVVGGRNVVVFRDLVAQRWYRQR